MPETYTSSITMIRKRRTAGKKRHQDKDSLLITAYLNSVKAYVEDFEGFKKDLQNQGIFHQGNSTDSLAIDLKIATEKAKERNEK